MSRNKKRASGGGRGRGGQRKAPGARGGDTNPQQWQQRGDGWSSLEMNNKKFEAYYLDQGILPQQEWAEFLDAFRQPLPTTFRFTAGKKTTLQLLSQMKQRFVPELSGIIFEGETVKPPQTLNWYPEGLAWQVDVRKGVLRKQPAFKNFQSFLVNETAVGSLSRQEAVSMIPPLFLDVQPHHLVLDMCAAPGSKTAQLIEALHSPITSSPEHYDPCPPGMIVANDSDQKRAYMLVHQATRLPSPNLCVTNLDAGAWPKIQVPWKGKDPSSSVTTKDLKFDRILGDVPCSGDGTLRKNVAIWKEWTTNNGQGLHPLQLRILLKGLASLCPGGRLVYSTCSLNPLENEAVVAAALRSCGGKDGSVRLVDVSDHIPQLKRAKGLTNWKVCPGKGRHLFEGSAGNLQPKQEARNSRREAEATALPDATEEDEDAAINGTAESVKGEPATQGVVPDEQEVTADSPGYRQTLPAIPWVDTWERLQELDPSMASKVPKSLWPAGDEVELGLERCMRVYPHYQNTGGFFIAVLEKKSVSDIESQSAGIARAVEAMDNGEAGPSYAGSSHKRAISPAAEEDGDALAGAAKKTKLEAADVATAQAAPESEQQPEAMPSAEVQSPAVADKAELQADRQNQRKTDSGYGLPGGTPFKEDPYEYIPVDNDQVTSIRNFFGFSSHFDSRNLLVRNAEAHPLRTIYLSSTAVRALITSGGPGIGLHRHLNPLKLRLLNAGTKAFARQESNKGGELVCKWRIIGDALPPLRPYLAESLIIEATLTDLVFLLSEYYPLFDRIPAGDFKEVLTRDRKMGSYVIHVVPSEHEGVALEEGIDLPIWRAGASVNLMLDKADRSALSCRIFHKDITLGAKMRMEQTQGNPSIKPSESLSTSADLVSDAAGKEDMLDGEAKEEQGISVEADESGKSLGRPEGEERLLA